MKQAVKTSLLYWFQPKALVFGLAVFNFVLIWSLVQRMGGIAAVVDPWYRPWSYYNEPTRLLVAASLLLVNRAWSYLTAIGIGGYIVVRFLYFFAIWEGTWHWTYLSKYEPHLVAAYENQVLLGLIVVCAGLYYLARGLMRSRSRAIVGG